MRCQFASVRCVIPMILLALGVLFSPSDARAGTQQSAGPTFGVDDRNSAVANPYGPIAVSTIGSNPPGQCAWINTGLAAFSAANPSDPNNAATDGTGPSGQGWTFTWAGAAQEAQVEAGIKIIDYYPWVVNEPSVYSANPNIPNGLYPGANMGDVGGAVFNLQYTPQPGAPVLNNLHWVQGLMGTAHGATIPTGLDNFTNYTTFTRDNSSPFYDGGLTPGTAGAINQSNPAIGQGGWFLDTPQFPEKESDDANENIPILSVQFQVVLANDTTSVDKNGVTQNNVTLYGGEWWGVTYTAKDAPEPSTYVLLAFGGIGLFFFRRMSSRKRAS
jgi:hypothetical protein